MTVHREKLCRNNQLDASNIQHLFCHKTLHFSGIFFAHHQEFSTVRTGIGTFHAGYMNAPQQSQVETEFQPVFSRKWLHNLHETYQFSCV